MEVDYFFFYKNLIRFISICKLNNIYNTYKVINIEKLLFSFYILGVEDITMFKDIIIYIYLNFFLVDIVF